MTSYSSSSTSSGLWASLASAWTDPPPPPPLSGTNHPPSNSHKNVHNDRTTTSTSSSSSTSPYSPPPSYPHEQPHQFNDTPVPTGNQQQQQQSNHYYLSGEQSQQQQQQQQQGHPPPIPPSHPSEKDSTWTRLPPGWMTARNPQDGRMFYWDTTTGKTSWEHPLAMQQQQPQPEPQHDNHNNTTTGTSTGTTGTTMVHPPLPTPMNRHQEWHDTPLNASRRPDSRQCWACMALVLCFPMGVCAMGHSFQVDRSWNQGRYGDAVNHSRQADKYANLAVCVGIVFWIYVLFLKEGAAGKGMFDANWMPDWNF